MKRYGDFDDSGEFRVTDPRTPEPWLHYLIRPGQPGTDTFASGITASAGGFDVRGTHENTLVDARIHLNDRDDTGRYVYLRDAESGKLFSTSWQPVRAEGQKCETAFGFSRVAFEAECDGIETSDEMFLPLEFDGWVREISVTNRSPRRRALDVAPFVPVHMGNALTRLLAGDNDAFFGGARWDGELKGIVFRRHHGIPVRDDPAAIRGMLGNVALFHCTLNGSDTQYETDMEAFLGDRFRDLSNPESLVASRLSCRDTPHLRRACGAFLHRLALEPGETARFAVVLALGSTADYYRGGKKELRGIVSLAASADSRKAMRSRVASWWKERLDRIRAELPEPDMKRSWPWLQYQCEIVSVLNRMKSRFHSGYEYGWGFRDLLQDIRYFAPTDTAAMRDAILFAAAQIFPDGMAYHNFFLDQTGNRSVEASDDPLWFVDAVIEWCRETGDFSFLEEIAPWADGSSGTLAAHCEACLARVLSDRSERGLPWMKDCDWNDDLNETRFRGEPSRRSESVMVAEQLVGTLRAWAGLLERSKPGDAARAAGLRAEADRVVETLLRDALDPARYFRRALAPDGDLGSSLSAEGRIFLETQVFAVNAGVISGKEAEGLLEATALRLDTERGAMLCHPHFRGLAERDELPAKTWNIEKEPPGMKENGGIFMHLNAWLVEAWCRAGRGSEAVALYRKTLPERLAEDRDAYRCEPFVYPEYVCAPESARPGRGGHTWLTGTAPTLFRSLTERILGVRSDWDGLVADPCVDPSWKTFGLTRRFRGATYRIRFENPDGAETGIRDVFKDGKPVAAAQNGRGVILPPPEAGETSDYLVIMGERRS